MAAPVGVHLFPEIFQDVARAAAGRLRVLDHRLERATIALAPFLVRVEIGAQVHGREMIGEPLPASAPMLAYEPVPLEENEGDARLP